VEEIDQLISKFDIIEIPREEYDKFKAQAKMIISHESDIAFISTSLFLNCPIWSGNVNHFKSLKNSKEIIWFTSKELFDFLSEKYFIH